MGTGDLALLAAGGFAAGVVNTLAGGGSLLTVPLLVFLGLPGTIANGTNRIGILVQNLTAAWRFRSEGVSGLRESLPVLVAVVTGSFVGAVAISRLEPATFERVFGLVMLAMILPILRGTLGTRANAASRTPWSAPVRAAVFFAIGVYGGALQAGIGVFLIFALSRAGYDLVLSNSIKAVVITALTAVAVPVFIASGQVEWPAAAALVVGFALGGAVGVRVAVLGGETVIRPVLLLAVVAMAGRMLGLY